MFLNVESLESFVSAVTGEKLEEKSFPGGYPRLVKELPPVEEEENEFIESQAELLKLLIDIVGGGNFVTSLVLGHSMQFLWGMIRAL